MKQRRDRGKASAAPVAWIAAHLFPLARVTGLHDAHQMSMVPLLLGFAATGGGISDVPAILGEDLHARQVGEVTHGGAW